MCIDSILPSVVLTCPLFYYLALCFTCYHHFVLAFLTAFPSQAAAAQSQSLQQQHSQGSAPSNQYMHTAPSHANAANQMQQSHHTTPPLQQSQQSQSSNHPVIASQGQFPQHGGRPSPGPMQPQMTHAQAQAQVVQPQGGMAQVSQLAPSLLHEFLHILF